MEELDEQSFYICPSIGLIQIAGKKSRSMSSLMDFSFRIIEGLNKVVNTGTIPKLGCGRGLILEWS